MKPSNIGGQAVMEGIMMRHKDKYSVAVRRPDKEIEIKTEDYKCTFGKSPIWKKPLLRGVAGFVDSLVVGTKCLMYSAMRLFRKRSCRKRRRRKTGCSKFCCM